MTCRDHCWQLRFAARSLSCVVTMVENRLLLLSYGGLLCSVWGSFSYVQSSAPSNNTPPTRSHLAERSDFLERLRTVSGGWLMFHNHSLHPSGISLAHSVVSRFNDASSEAGLTACRFQNIIPKSPSYLSPSAFHISSRRLQGSIICFLSLFNVVLKDTFVVRVLRLVVRTCSDAARFA